MRGVLTRKDFLYTLFHPYFMKREGFILVRAVRHLDHKVSTRFFPNLELLSREQYQEEQHVYFGVCPRESMKPDSRHIRYLVALWAGMDLTSEGYSGRHRFFFGHSQAAKAIRSFPLPPSIIVESGWGVHLYWLLKEVAQITDPAPVEKLLRKINSYFQCNTEISLDAVLRLPGTINCKIPSHCVECRVKYINSDFCYDLKDFENLNLGNGGSTSRTSIVDKSLQEESLQRSIRTDNDTTRKAPIGQANQRAQHDLSSSQEVEALQSAVMDVVADLDSGSTIVVCTEDSGEPIADEIVDKVVEKLSGKFVDRLADEIVDRLVKRLKLHPR